jgi:hypothetical protein
LTTISRIFRVAAAVTAVAFSAEAYPAAGETLTVTVDKSELLRIGRAASTVVVGQPSVADVQVESPRLVLVLGRAVGETNLIILDSNGDEIANYSVLVVPESDRHVTIFHGGDGVSTLSCNPRCAGVKNPGTEKEPGNQGGPAAGGALGGAPAGGGAGGGAQDLSALSGTTPAAPASGAPSAPAGGQTLSPGTTMKKGEPY